jgi:hypothetical protein
LFFGKKVVAGCLRDRLYERYMRQRKEFCEGEKEDFQRELEGGLLGLASAAMNRRLMEDEDIGILRGLYLDLRLRLP